MTVATKEKPAAKSKPADLKLTVDRGDFLRALAHAAAIVERRNTIPVLSNVLLEASADALQVTSTDLDLQVSLKLPASVESDGGTTVSAQLLHGIVREMEDGCQVELSLAEGRLQVRSGRSNYKLQTRDRSEFPVMQLGQTLSSFVLPADGFLQALKRVEFAQSTEEARAYLRGVHVEVSDGELVFAATDGNALGVATVPAPKGADVATAILPTKLVSTLMKLLDAHEGEVRLFFEDRKAIFEIGSTVLTGKLVEGTYPQWRRVLPMTEGKKLLIGAATLETAIRRATIVANEKLRAVKIELSTDKLTASCTSPEYGFGVEEAPCVWDGGDFQIGFNSRMLLEAIKASGAEELEVHLIDAAAPPLFTNPADDSSKFIVMPMRV